MPGPLHLPLARCRRAFIVIFLLVTPIPAPIAGSAPAPRVAEVRGRIVRSTSMGILPAAGIVVTFNREGAGRSAPVITGPTGWYGFVGVGQGTVTVEVWPYGFQAGAQVAPIRADLAIPAGEQMTVAPDLTVP